jgi:hypothetical protein
MWKSVSFLSSQVVEAFLKRRLRQLPRPPDISRVHGLGQMINIARKTSLLPGYDDAAVGLHSASAATVLRNWSAHFDLWAGYPTELRACHAVTLMICAVEALQPRPRAKLRKGRASAWNGEWRGYDPRFVISRLAHLPSGQALPSAIASSLEEFIDFAIRETPSGVCSLKEIADKGLLPAALLADVAALRFTSFITHAATQREQTLFHIVRTFRQLGMPKHARVFAILLPFDINILIDIIKTRPAVSVVFYLKACMDAEPDVFRDMFRHETAVQTAASLFWRTIHDRTSKLGNVAGILGAMPTDAQAVFMRHAPLAEFRDWIRHSDPADAVNVLRLINDVIAAREPRLRGILELVVKAIEDGIQLAPYQNLHQIPLRLHKVRVSGQECGRHVMLALLSRVTQTALAASEWSAARRIVCDTWTYCPELADAAADTALHLGHSPAAPLWERACLLGVAALEGKDIAGCAPNVTTLDLPVGNFDRWQVFFAALGFDALYPTTPLPEAIRRFIIDHPTEPSPATPAHSRHVLSRVSAVVAKQSSC